MEKSLRFYTDAHIDKQVAIQLRVRGYSVIRCQEIGMSDATDEEHLEFAVRNSCMLITKDSDFIELHYRWLEESKRHYGILFDRVRQFPRIGDIVNACVEYGEIVSQGAASIEELSNKLLTIR